MPDATLTTKGQITIPADVRRKLDLHPGDRVDFILDDKGGVRLAAKKRPLTDLLGLLRQPDRAALSVEEMDEAVLRGVGEDWERIQADRD